MDRRKRSFVFYSSRTIEFPEAILLILATPFFWGPGSNHRTEFLEKQKNDHSQFVHEIEFYVTSRQISTLVAQEHFGLEKTKPLIDNSTVDRF
jgi:hypothetical protein